MTKASWRHAIGAAVVAIMFTSCETTSQFSEGSGFIKLGEKGWIKGPWRNKAIPVCWVKIRQEEAVERAWVQEAAEKSWDAESGVDFTGWGECEAGAPGIRIQFGETGAATQFLGEPRSGPSAGRNKITLVRLYRRWNKWCSRTEELRQNCLRANAVHEFGHALGFAHEHNRHDRPRSCRARRQGGNGEVILTPWDPASIMNYCNRRRMYEGGRLSTLDVASVVEVYGRP